MAIAFDAASNGRVNPGTSLTVAHTCSGSDRVLAVAVTSDTTDVVTGVTYNGVSMTQVNKTAASGGRFTYLYSLTAPATGTNNIVASTSSSVYIEINAASYTGVSQTGQPEVNGVANNSSGGTPYSSSLTTTTDNSWVVMAATAQSGTIAAGTATTRRATNLVGAIFDSGGAVTPAGSRTLEMTFASATFVGVVKAAYAPASAPADTITVTSPVQYQTYQRSGSTASISISGTYTGTPTSIEASFNGGSYSTIVASPSGGSFTGTLSSQTQGQGTLTVRFTNNTSISATVADVGIGDVFVVAGDSIAEGRGTSAQSYTHGSLKATKFTQADAWGNGNDGIDTGTSSGSHWPLLATQIMADQSVPVAFISVGTGSTDVAGSANQWAKNNSAYAEMTAQVTASGVNGVKGVLFHLGPNAVVNASTLSKATYNTAIDTLATDVAADIAGAPKIHVTIFGEVTTGSPPDRRAAIDNIRAAIIEAIGDNANVEPGPCLVDQDYTDGVHPQSNTHLGEVAGRWWVALDESLYGGSGGRGPRIASAQWNAARTDLTVVFDRVLKTGLSFGTGAWIVSDNGTPMTVTGVAYHGSNTSAVVLTTSAAASGPAGTTTVSLASSNDAAGVVIPKSADITMPSGSAIQIPAEPIYAAAVGETIAVPAGSLSLTGFAPTVSVGAAQNIAVPAGSLALTGFAPTVVNPNTIAVPAGSLTLTAFAPTVNSSADKTIAVPAGSLALTGLAPTVTKTDGNFIEVPAGSLVLTGYAPTVLGATAVSQFAGGSIKRKKSKYDHLDPESVRASVKTEEEKPPEAKPKKAPKPAPVVVARGGALTELKPIELPKEEPPKVEAAEEKPKEEPKQSLQQTIEAAIRTVMAEFLASLESARQEEKQRAVESESRKAHEDGQRAFAKAQQEAASAEEDGVLELVSSMEQQPRQMLLDAYERVMKLMKTGL